MGAARSGPLLADALEAIIAGLYLDGGIDVARRISSKPALRPIPRRLGENGEIVVSDYKSALQETAQALKLPQPKYMILGEHGPEHSKTFTVEVRVGKDWVSRADGNSKKSAGQKAAQLVLQQLTDWGTMKLSRLSYQVYERLCRYYY